MTTAAAAQEIELADIFLGEGDPQSNEFLNMIFGPLFPVTGTVAGADETLVSTLIGNFNVLFFAVGILLLVYNIIVGVTETAHDGSVLGQRHSSLWAPLRTIVAAALLIPMPTGYNGVQHGIAYVVNAGTATASFFWDQTVDAIVEDRMPVAAPDYVSLDAQFLQAVWRMELCMAAYNQEVAKGGSLEQMTAGWAPGVVPGVYMYSITDRQGACGQISLPAPSGGFERIAEAAGGSYDQWHASMQQAVDTMISGFREDAVAVAQAASAREPLPAPRKLAADLTKWRQEHRRVMDPFVEKVEEQAREAAADELSGGPSAGTMDTKLAANLRDGGWSQAGFYYQLISRFSADASSVQRMMPLTTPGDAIGASTNPYGATFSAVRSQMGGRWWNPFSDANGDAEQFLAEIANTYNVAVNWWNESVTRSGIRAFTNERQAFADSGGDMSNWMPSAGNMFEAMRFLNPVGGDQDPMIGLVTFGNAIATLCATALAGLALLAAIPIVGSSVVFIGTVLGWVISATALAGAFLAFILPMIPTVIWVLGVSAFFLLVVEAIFAGPLWAISHLTMDGEGLAGRAGRRGYVMLLALFLTPVLMLFGFLIGLIIFRITGTLINGGFYYAITSAQSLSTDAWLSAIWFLGIFVVMVFLGIVYVIVIERSFSLITEFPGRVFRWFDDIGSDLDSRTAERARVAALSTGAATGQAFGAVGRGTQRAIGLRDALRDRSQRRIGPRDA